MLRHGRPGARRQSGSLQSSLDRRIQASADELKIEKAVLINDLEANAWGIAASTPKIWLRSTRSKGSDRQSGRDRCRHWVGRSRDCIGTARNTISLPPKAATLTSLRATNWKWSCTAISTNNSDTSATSVFFPVLAWSTSTIFCAIAGAARSRSGCSRKSRRSRRRHLPRRYRRQRRLKRTSARHFRVRLWRRSRKPRVEDQIDRRSLSWPAASLRKCCQIDRAAVHEGFRRKRPHAALDGNNSRQRYYQ